MSTNAFDDTGNTNGQTPPETGAVCGTPQDDVLTGTPGNDAINGSAGDDIISGEAGDDTLTGGSGNDDLSGGAGNDLLIGEGPDCGQVEGLTITFEGEIADFRNALGVYTIDPVTGAISNVQIAFPNTSLPGSGGDLPAGSTYGYSAPPGTQVGVFLVSDGASQNDFGALTGGRFEFQNADGTPATIGSTAPQLVYIGGDGSVTPINGGTFHTAGFGENLPLNSDGLLHTAGVSENPDGSVTIGFEDVPGLGDADFDDTIFSFDVDSTGTRFVNAHYDVVDDGTGGGTGTPGSNALFGGDGDDTLIGGDNVDVLRGGDGDDSIVGGGGNDTIEAGGGASPLPDRGYPGLFPGDTDIENDRDFVDAGDGDDLITTGDDRDTIIGGGGNDTIDAGFDDDLVSGDGGDDLIVAGEGSDTVDGGAGNDTIYGGLDPRFPDSLNIRDDEGDRVTDNGRDLLQGGDGDDVIYGQDDDDTILGGAGNDTLDAGIDDDEVRGGDGDDSITGGQGNDTLYGDDGRDTFFNVNPGDVIEGGSGGDDFDTLDLRGAGPLRVRDLTPDSDGNGFDGRVVFRNPDGTPNGELVFTNIENIVPCFTPGTLIATPRGERPVEELRVGDKIITRDNGIQEIRWVGRKDMNHADFAVHPHLRPVLIRQGSLGNGLPERDMMVSPNHRMLVANDRTALYFDEHEVLVAAKHLVSMDAVRQVTTSGTAYIHFLCDKHEVVLSNGAWSESFQPGEYTLGGLGNAQRNEIFELFPELRSEQGQRSYGAARKTLKAFEARLLAG
jgi:Ca2+-binding RTX toxin-like protein